MRNILQSEEATRPAPATPVVDWLDIEPDSVQPCLGCAHLEDYLGRVFWTDQANRLYCRHCTPPPFAEMCRRRLVLVLDDSERWVFWQSYPLRADPLEAKEAAPEQDYRKIVDADVYFDAIATVKRIAKDRLNQS